eukprot:TRINITY_DN4707_c0_g1_i1.p1 TRINITY_DN4707_c0_g1~~TRINITY_DN4707_c0_g1_i1.p1  ORF type:complete len:100 (+),score=14.23 TRINITY_DN4707_c0_g1_i1:40-300(+)
MIVILLHILAPRLRPLHLVPGLVHRLILGLLHHVHVLGIVGGEHIGGQMRIESHERIIQVHIKPTWIATVLAAHHCLDHDLAHDSY